MTENKQNLENKINVEKQAIKENRPEIGKGLRYEGLRYVMDELTGREADGSDIHPRGNGCLAGLATSMAYAYLLCETDACPMSARTTLETMQMSTIPFSMIGLTYAGAKIGGWYSELKKYIRKKRK